MNNIINTIGYINIINIFWIILIAWSLSVKSLIIQNIPLLDTGIINKNRNKHSNIKIINTAYNLLLIILSGSTLYISLGLLS